MATMVSVSALLALILGLPLGVLLVVTTPGHILAWPAVNRVIGTFVNLIRSTPFVIMMVVIVQLVQLIGDRAAIAVNHRIARRRHGLA